MSSPDHLHQCFFAVGVADGLAVQSCQFVAHGAVETEMLVTVPVEVLTIVEVWVSVEYSVLYSVEYSVVVA